MFALSLAVLLSAAPAAPRGVVTQGLVSVTALAPWLSSPVAFREVKNRKTITGALEVLAHLQHPFFHEPGSSSTNVGELFGTEADLAQREFAAGKTEAARFRVQALTQLCLACHLREPTGDFEDASGAVEGLQLAPLHRAQYFALTRQFELALGVWQAELARPVRLESEQFEQLEALRMALRVAVRVKDDPRLAQQLLAPQLARTKLPGFAMRDLQAWQVAAVAWEHERFVLSQRSPAALVARARELVASTGATTNVSPMPQHFLTLVRAASYLDEAMRQDSEGVFRGEALYLLGVAHATISESSLWKLEWMYFETCIRENAGTLRASMCGERLKERTWSLWGADMPAPTQGALKALLVLSTVDHSAPRVGLPL